MKGKPVERDVDRMRAALARAADPVPAGRPAGRAERDRHVRQLRRRRGAVGGAVLLAVVAFVIVTPHFLKTSPTTNADTDPTNGAAIAADPARTHPCPDDPINLDVARTTTTLPGEPVSVRLCHAVVALAVGEVTAADPTWSQPSDALIADAPRFVQEVNALPTYDAGACSAVAPTGGAFAIVVRYADVVRVLGAPAPECAPITIGDREVDSAGVLKAYADLTGEPLPWTG
jgi:hypothetical protein